MGKSKYESFTKVSDYANRKVKIVELLSSRIDGLSRRELSRELHLEINRITAPALELIREGLIVEAGTRFDRETLRNVAVLYVVPSSEEAGL